MSEQINNSPSISDRIQATAKMSPLERIRAFRAMQLISHKDERKLVASVPPAPPMAQQGQPTMLWLSRFITEHPLMLQVKEDVRKLAMVDDPVLIQGETGTGKELIARALHGTRHGKFVDINCAGLPDNLIESELFGHVKGAFTGAFSDKAGLFQEAANGTIFLDEVGELKPLLQSKLLRVVQQKVVRRVGSNDNETISCRIVCATHKDLYEAHKSGEFREDLYYRLAVFELKLLPLRERGMEDFNLLIKSLGGFEEDTESLWPNRATSLAGNVRSVQRYMKRKKLGVNI